MDEKRKYLCDINTFAQNARLVGVNFFGMVKVAPLRTILALIFLVPMLLWCAIILSIPISFFAQEWFIGIPGFFYTLISYFVPFGNSPGTKLMYCIPYAVVGFLLLYSARKKLDKSRDEKEVVK
jgi:hypothetical protein